MPSGRTHLAIEAGFLAPLAGAGGALVVRGTIAFAPFAAFLAGYLFSMIFLSPDLDLEHSHAMRRWGPLGILWRPYAALFRHRGASHHLILGPLSRLLYLGALCIAGLATAHAIGGGGWVVPGWSLGTVAAGLGGAYIPNALHILADARGRRSSRG